VKKKLKRLDYLLFVVRHMYFHLQYLKQQMQQQEQVLLFDSRVNKYVLHNYSTEMSGMACYKIINIWSQLDKICSA